MDSLNRHSLMSSKQGTHACNTCGKQFSSKGNLKAHSLIHTGQKPHVCGTCGRFSQKNNMERHCLIQIRGTSHVCDTCGKQFRYISCLVKHRKVHTEAKPYSCRVCETTFKYKSHLKQHVKKTCDNSHKFTGIFADVLNNSKNISVFNNPSLCEPAGETDERKNRTQPPPSGIVTLFQDSMNFRQKSPSSVARKATEYSIPQNFGTFHVDSNAPKRGGQLTTEDTHNMQLQSNNSSESSELHGHFSKLDDSIDGNNLTLPVARYCSGENTPQSLQLESASWSAHEQASTSMNGSSATVDMQRAESPTPDTETLFEDALSLIQKSPSSVVIKARGTSLAQHIGTFHDYLNTPMRSDHFSSEGTRNVELQSKSISELRGYFRRINPSNGFCNHTAPVSRDCSREHILQPLQLEASSWSAHEQAKTLMNDSSVSSSRQFRRPAACGFLPDNPLAYFVGWDYSEHNPSTSTKTFFDL